MAQEPHQYPHDDGAHHEHAHDHEHAHGRMGRLIAAVPFLQEHSHGEAHVDRAMETSDRGVWALKVSLMGLGATALFQLVIVILSGSVGLLAESIHNIADAFTAVPLWIAFAWARRPASRSYTYGYGRAEDVAGVVIVLMIFLSSLLAAYESSQKLLHPEPLRDVGWVMAAVEPQQVEALEREARAIPGVDDVHEVRLRWIGHTLYTELQITVNEDLSTWESHQIAEQVRHALFVAQAKLATVMAHVDPCGHGGKDPHAPLPHRATCPP